MRNKSKQNHIVLALVFTASLLSFTAVAQVPAESLKVRQNQASLNNQWAQQMNADYNLYRVAPNFYRSRQIDKKALPILQKLGVTTVINLRANHSDDKYLAGTNIRMLRIPMHTWNIEDEDIIAALRAIHEGTKQGVVLVHCQHGADRTGVVSAMYRILYQGWTRKQALDELKNGGFGFHSIWMNIPSYVEHVDLEKIKKAVNAK